MSPQALNEQPRYRKPRPDIYTLLLGLALVAIIIACVFLYLEVADYGSSPLSARPSTAAPGAVAARLASAAPGPLPYLPESCACFGGWVG